MNVDENCDLKFIGASAVVSIAIYVGETSQPQLRNMLSAFTVIGFSVGVSVTLTLG